MKNENKKIHPHQASQHRESISRALRDGGGAWISGEALAREHGVSRAAVSAHIASLRSEGWVVESATRKGYRLHGMDPLPEAREVKPHLETKNLGRTRWDIRRVTDSTNLNAAALAAGGEPEGLVVVTGRQTQGRGRRGHSWASLPGALMFSVLFRPGVPEARLESGVACDWSTALTLCALDSVCATLGKDGIVLTRKAPNDLLLNGRKVCGVLAEAAMRGSEIEWVVLGVGCNVNAQRGDMPHALRTGATSLFIETNRVFSRSTLLGSMLNELELRYRAAAGNR